MKAEWLESTDKNVCLCCGQLVIKSRSAMTPSDFATEWRILEGLGFTRKALLTKHRAQIDYQSPGFAEWLQGQ
jgi:hypothetical protein